MTVTEKSINNSMIANMVRKAAPRVVSAIRQASARTGVDFAYLMEKAAAESSFNPAAKSKTSSATGLFQFIESTWMKMVKAHGAKYGLGGLADAIDEKGRVSDPETKQEILALRNDPEKAAALAAEYALENKHYLERAVDGGQVGPTELYLAHFLGAGGAAGFLNAMKENPLAPAADLMPKAARANRGVFYDKATGQPRTLAAVYDLFARKFQGSAATSAVAPLRQHAPQQQQAALQESAPADEEPLLTAAIPALPDYDSLLKNRTIALLGGGTGGEKRPAPAPVIPGGAGLVMRPVDIMMMAKLDMPGTDENGPARRHRYND